MCLVLDELGVHDRDIYLFDTFEGMTEPSAVDVGTDGERATERYDAHGFDFTIAPVDFVRQTIAQSSYPQDRLRFVAGRVEDTVPAEAPDEIALLRLDTDWYASTKHELEHLYPRLSTGGVLIIDDYGHYEGARKATDEYFAETHAQLLLGRIDYTARIVVKPG
jgi:hypothetical protein